MSNTKFLFYICVDIRKPDLDKVTGKLWGFSYEHGWPHISQQA